MKFTTVSDEAEGNTIDPARPVALVGAGTIGASWSIVFARSGFETRLFDADRGQLAVAQERLQSRLKLLQAAGRISSDEERSTISDRITYTHDLEKTLAGVAYVQESVPERLDIKRSVIEAIDLSCAPDVVIGSSASALPMTEIAANTQHPERCVVVHPTNPPHIVPLVEIVPGQKTSPEVVEAAYRLMKLVGQVPIVCKKEIFGFVLNRLQFALVREAFYLAREGVATVPDIDKCISEGLGLRWAALGPFGVEATNAESIEDDLRKFRESIVELMGAVCQSFDGLTEEDIHLAVAGAAEIFGDTPHEQLVAYRDEIVLRVRGLKEHARPWQEVRSALPK